MTNFATNLPITQPKDTPRAPWTASPSASASARPAVLLALFEEGCPTASLLRALALSRVVGADLHVMRVLPEHSRVNALFPQNHAMDALRTVERTVQANRSTREWLAGFLGADAKAVERFAVVHGDFVDQVAGQAAHLGAELIVVPPRAGRMGRTVTSLASTSGVPVLVAREATHDETIIAATDLKSASYPVLRRAAELGQQLDAPVIAIHNMSPVPFVVGAGMGWPTTVLPGDPGREACSARLSQVCSERLPVEASAVIRNEVNPVDAILAEARRHDADLVVVGTRRRGWFGRLLAGSVAAQVVNRAKRSVLVTPLDDVGPLAGAPIGCA